MPYVDGFVIPVHKDKVEAYKIHARKAGEMAHDFFVPREALTVARLHHPSILEIYDYSGEDSEVRFIATELLSGPTGSSGPLASATARRVVRRRAPAAADRPRQCPPPAHGPGLVRCRRSW